MYIYAASTAKAKFRQKDFGLLTKQVDFVKIKLLDSENYREKQVYLLETKSAAYPATWALAV